MKKLMRWMLLGLALGGMALAVAPVATAQSPVTLTLYNPTGGYQITQTFAPRVADLNGKTVCEVTNSMWETGRTFPLIAQLLQKQFPTAKIVTYDQAVPFTLSSSADVPGLEDAVKAKGCQAVIVGNAG